MKKIILLALLIAPLSAFAQKFGHFNSVDIMQAMPEYTQAQTELETLQKQYEDDLKRMQDELVKKGSEYEKERANLLDNVRQRREAELNDLQMRIQQSYDDNRMSLQKLSQEKMQAITQKVLDAVKEIGTAGGYVYIMDVTAGVPYISATLSTDVTTELKNKLGLK
ncbi:MAG: OmpH family outer membrane protein [Paraprevotella sp.]|jgi:cationic outer membrane protein ompH|nr:OmpH family outer membrane protein [Paraprevotella sp.]